MNIDEKLDYLISLEEANLQLNAYNTVAIRKVLDTLNDDCKTFSIDFLANVTSYFATTAVEGIQLNNNFNR